MSTFIVAATPDKTKLAQCMIMGEKLNDNCPDISVQFIVKDETEWESFLDGLTRTYGFDKSPNPICYTLEGDFIGDGADFLDYIRKKYNKTETFTSEITRNRTKINEEENEDRMRKLTDVESLGEKVNSFLEKAKQKNFQQLIDDAFYEQVHQAGIPF